MNHRISTRPQTAMELAFLKAVQEHATRKNARPLPRSVPPQQAIPKKQ